jgi:hypothetical protein
MNAGGLDAKLRSNRFESRKPKFLENRRSLIFQKLAVFFKNLRAAANP